VDGDGNGKLDGRGNNGYASLVRVRNGVTFVIDINEYGGYPTQFGLVTTDGCPCFASFYDSDGELVAQLTDPVQNYNINTTDDDRFLGITYDEGIARVNARGIEGDLEVDHLQIGGALPGIAQGDFDSDGDLDLDDWDKLINTSHQSPVYSSRLDLDAGGSINQRDGFIWWQLSPLIQGDVNLDGAVDFTDFLVLSDNFQTERPDRTKPPKTYSQGDLNGNGAVQFSDFTILASNYGTTVASQAASVPEPSLSLAIMLPQLLVSLLVLRSHPRRILLHR
jgi:hypothetical protein